jgi:hypothetical protein
VQILFSILQNAFIEAILPGLEGESGRKRGDREGSD